MSVIRQYDPAIKAIADIFPRFDVSDAVSVRVTLAAMAQAAADMGIPRPSDPNIEEIERMIPGPAGAPDVRVRIYMPKDRTEAGPGFVNFHGGGFIQGDLESEHARCLAMTAQGGAVSVGVDYRLAPEHPFPAGVEDCYAALKWVAEKAIHLSRDSE